MYKHILLPTDGSERSRQAIEAAVQLARSVGAEVHGIYVVPVLHLDHLDAFVHKDAAFVEKQRELFERIGGEYLDQVRAIAERSGVQASCSRAYGSPPSEAIVARARELNCDLIYMASQGWGGDQLQLLGSVTSKVLHSSPVPVLVHRYA